eukprot:CAMPEP_0174948738 /NCGR_PEP_ID=MMETSP1355-20121228/89833_1 /TAXON_ID=464990 /ORGANISM="Hemiselmis tepida, Strain CCMP443" /LENGTH=159 /DNA_ID=CAMNT_0016196271 /DNA_START=88 /DNA_END=567 /DNA_ORIENTATION=+
MAPITDLRHLNHNILLVHDRVPRAQQFSVLGVLLQCREQTLVLLTAHVTYTEHSEAPVGVQHAQDVEHAHQCSPPRVDSHYLAKRYLVRYAPGEVHASAEAVRPVGIPTVVDIHGSNHDSEQNDRRVEGHEGGPCYSDKAPADPHDRHPLLAGQLAYQD